MANNSIQRQDSQLQYSQCTLLQGQRGRSGRPGDHRTNILTEIASPTLTYRREVFVLSVQIHAGTNVRSKHKRELRRLENKQILSTVATHS